MLIGLDFTSKISLEKMLFLAGESNFDFVVVNGKKKALSAKEKEMLESYTLTIACEGEKGLVVVFPEKKAMLGNLKETNFDGKLALITPETDVKKLKKLREEFEAFWFGKDYVEGNRDYLGGY